MQTIFDLIHFKKLNFKEWKFRYLSDIRIGILWKNLKDVNVGILLVKNHQIYLPKYGKDKSWMNGKPIKVNEGKRLILVRLPAIRIKNKYLILDGYHRLKNLKPKLIILDYLRLSQSQYRYIIDLYNEYWMGYIKK